MLEVRRCVDSAIVGAPPRRLPRRGLIDLGRRGHTGRQVGVYSILHISDLHRTPNARISNAELLSALLSDRDSYTQGNEPIRAPDAIVVSGDVVQGVSLAAKDPHSTLQEQYEEAEYFLSALAERMVSGDRSKVILVPGNHDIDWTVARSAMALVQANDRPKNVLRALQEPDSLFRFSWDTCELFKIVDVDKYATRFDAFWKFFDSFYAGASGLLRVASKSDANIFSLCGGRVGIAAFNSCHGNDCFAFHGAIPGRVIGQTYLDMGTLGPFELSIAVWHHNLEGPPYRTDYMDIEIVRAMIGRGFRVGMYGHQHRTQVSAQSLRLATSQTMAILGTGALCAGGSELPNGSHRQYSIVEIDDDLRSARVHVREVMDSDMFGPAALAAFGRRASTEVSWDAPTTPLGVAIDTSKRAAAVAVADAERLVKAADHSGAVAKLWPLRDRLAHYGRRLLVQASADARDWGALTVLTEQPGTIEELVLGVEARVRAKDTAGAKALVDRNAHRLSVPEHQVQEMTTRVTIEEGLRKR